MKLRYSPDGYIVFVVDEEGNIVRAADQDDMDNLDAYEPDFTAEELKERTRQ